MRLASPAVQAGPNERGKVVCVGHQRPAPVLVGQHDDSKTKQAPPFHSWLIHPLSVGLSVNKRSMASRILRHVAAPTMSPSHSSRSARCVASSLASFLYRFTVANADAPVANRCQIAAVGWKGAGMIQVLLREHNHGAIGGYTFEALPRIGDTINIRQKDKSTFFQVSDVEHVITDSGKPADAIVVVKRVVKWPP